MAAVRRLRTRLVRVRMAVEDERIRHASAAAAAMGRLAPGRTHDLADGRARAGRHDSVCSVCEEGEGTWRYCDRLVSKKTHSANKYVSWRRFSRRSGRAAAGNGRLCAANELAGHFEDEARNDSGCCAVFACGAGASRSLAR